MAHKRTIIRQYFQQYLKDNVISVSQRVYSGRIDPLREKDITNLYPFISISSKDEDILETYNNGYTVREFDLLVGLVIKDNQTEDSDFDELIENLTLEVETAMSAVPYQTTDADGYTLFTSLHLDNTRMMTNNESKADIGQCILTYRINYNYQEPIVPLTLADFDLDLSIANLKVNGKVSDV